MNELPFRGKACWQISDTTNSSLHVIQSLTVEECIKATIVLLITIAVIVLNTLMIVVLHSKNYSRYLRDLPKILMTSLSLTDLAVGILVTPISLISIVKQCWPWSPTVCAIEALLIAALFHESTLSLLCIAIDRYICIIHPLRYHTLMTKKVSLFHIYYNY
ncbi:histamine H2 receptor-like [Oppia nitens]|uniref:histamine H2 receptor-like n=1 Tax=Oppia nitens TaxID=1686743 RepID=UPI0023DA1A66|nr:histamine H2 receptor-like [Oppia nitens]XP_054159505.1 histamine H2 receptor-like [Oppia nitens]